MNKLGQGGFGPVYKVNRIQGYTTFIPFCLDIKFIIGKFRQILLHFVRGNLVMAKK